MAQRFVAACAVLAGPRLGVRAAKGDSGKRPPPGAPPDRDDDKYEGPDGKDGDEWEGDEEDWDESEGEDYDKEKSVEGNEWCLWEVKREFVNYGVNGGQCFGCASMADEAELVATCRELCLRDESCVAFETAAGSAGWDFYADEFEGAKYYLDGFEGHRINCCLEHDTSSSKGEPNSWQSSGDVGGSCPEEIELWTTRELIAGEAMFCDRDYAVDVGACAARKEYEFADGADDANVARRDAYLAGGCVPVPEGLFFAVVALCFFVASSVTFLTTACWLVDAVKDPDRKTRLRVGVAVYCVVAALVWFFGLLPAVYWLPPTYAVSLAGAGLGFLSGLACYARPIKGRVLAFLDRRSRYEVSPGDARDGAGEPNVQAELVPIEAVPVDRSPVVVDGRRVLPVDGGGDGGSAAHEEEKESPLARALTPSKAIMAESLRSVPRAGDDEYDVFISHCKKLPASEDRAIWLADLFEGENLKVFFDRSDLLEISESVLHDAIRKSRVLVTVVDPVCFESEWVANENRWAHECGRPIVAFYDRDRHGWDDISKWVPLHPHVFQRQAIPYTKDYRTEAKDKLLRQVDLARRDAAVRTNAALKGMHAAAGSATF